MANVKNVITRGIGAGPGSIKYFITGGLGIGTPAFNWDLYAYLDGRWTSIREDVMIWDYPLRAERGIDGSTPADRVAAPGLLSASLDNSLGNSAGLLGYYAPDHGNLRSGFTKGLPLRLQIGWGVQRKYIWRGKMDDLQPSPGQFKASVSTLTAYDFMKDMLDHNLNRITVQEDKRSDQLVQAVLDNMAAEPANTSMDTDVYTMDLGLHSEQDERSNALSAMQKVCQSALAYFYIRGDTTEGETAVFELYSTRDGQTIGGSFLDTMSEMKVTRGGERYFNKVIGTFHPTNVDIDGDTILASLPSEIYIDAGATETVSMRYRDPASKAVRISGKDIVDPLVADTHYQFSSSSGSGNDLNASLTPTLTIGGNATDVEAYNSAGVRGYLHFLEIVGNGIYQYEPQDITVESGDGDKSMTYDLFYQSDYYKAKAFITSIHLRVSEQVSHIEQLTIYADANETFMEYALDLDIGSRITVFESATGIYRDYTINKVIYTIQTDGRLRLDYVLEPALGYDYFRLDIDELDDTDIVLAI